MMVIIITTKVHSDESFRGNKKQTKIDLSDDGEDDYTGRDIKADNKHRSADSGVDAVLCVD